jgi:hypothetical protein
MQSFARARPARVGAQRPEGWFVNADEQATQVPPHSDSQQTPSAQ